MSHQYPRHEDHDLLYDNHTQQPFPQHGFHSYNTQPLTSYTAQPVVPPGGHQLSSQYSATSSAFAHPPSHQHLTPRGYQCPQYVSHSRYSHSPRFIPLQDTLHEAEVESQASCNEDTRASEPVVPPLDGFPDVNEFDQLVRSYVDDLSVKKQDKALIHARRARNIRAVLMDPKDTAIESAQFRFWVKKMFKLQPTDSRTPDSRRRICHEGKPVAIREKLFKILTKAHQQCQHGGRDKTSAQVRRTYSWVPKELISRFVKICPTCQVRRGGSRLTPPSSHRNSPQIANAGNSPLLLSPPESRRESALHRPSHANRPSGDGFLHLQGQGGWALPGQPLHTSLGMNHSVVGSLPSASPPTSSNATTMNSLRSGFSMPSGHFDYGSGYTRGPPY
ncbi:hypothetical protein FQN54_007688 [Arachnomyces sp. PD_36]|nr:hypothetical protein FQN54_007688 [Arachnomyces sp. PD_36]